MPPVRRKKKEKKVERTPTPFDPDQGFPREKLDEMLRTLREQLEKAQMDRNQIQVDRVRREGLCTESLWRSHCVWSCA